MIADAQRSSLRPYSREDRERSTCGHGETAKRGEIREHRQRGFTLSFGKTRRRPRHFRQRKNGEGIRECRVRPSERTNLTHRENEIRTPHNTETRVDLDHGPNVEPGPNQIFRLGLLVIILEGFPNDRKHLLTH